MHMLRFYIFLSFTLSFFQVLSQPRIVKDNIACTYGIKNEAGQWILEPSCILIEELPNQYFRTLTENGRGIFYNGKQLIENQFDEIFFEYNLFKVRKQSLFGLYSIQGTQIVPLDYNGFLFDGQIVIALNYKNQITFSTCYNLLGETLIPEVEGLIYGFQGKTTSLIGSMKTEYGVLGKAGLIDIKGNIIIPRIYDQLRFCNHDLTFKKDNKIGKISANNKIIFEGKTGISPLTYEMNQELPCFDTSTIYKFVENGKFGLINGKGKVILEPIIESIERSYHEMTNVKTAYIFKQNGKFGLISYDGKITVQAKYEQITAKPRLNWNNDYTKKKKLFFEVVQNNKIGIISDEGKLEMPCEYNRFFRLDYSKNPNYAIAKRDELFYLDFNKDNLLPQKMTLLHKQANTHLYQFKSEYFAFSSSKVSETTSYLGVILPLFTLGKFIFVTIDNQTFTYTLDGKPWTKYKNCQIQFQQDKYAFIRSKNAALGLLNVYTGKVILDTNYTEINLYFQQSNLLWGQVKIGEKKMSAQPTYYNQQGIYQHVLPSDFVEYTVPVLKWIPFDTLGIKLSKNTFDKSFSNYNMQIVSENELFGVVNKQFTWVIPPVYKSIKQFTTNMYVVLTQDEKYGIINEKNQVTRAANYTQYEPIFKGRYSQHDQIALEGAMQYERETWLLLKNAKEELLLSNFGEIIDGSSPDFKTKMLQFALLANENLYPNAFKIHMQKPLFNKNFDWSKNIQFISFHFAIYDLLRSQFNSQYAQEEHRHQASSTIELVEMGERFVSIKTTHFSNYMDDLDIHYYKHSYNQNQLPDIQNLIWKDGKLVQVTLTDIFGEGILFETELIEAIKKRDDLKLDCSSIDVLIDSFNDLFYFSEKGIHLLHNKSYLYELKEGIIIPIENLERNSTSVWICSLLK